MTILLAEPDDAEARRIMDALTQDGFPCERVHNGQDLLTRAAAAEALVAEIVLPGLSGLLMAQRLRETGHTTPLIFITSLGTPEQRVSGLEAGADDYLCKPFTLPELLARVRALIRRSRMPSRTRRIRVGDLVWEPDQRSVSRGGQRLDLTPKEYVLLSLLMERQGQVVSREDLARALWGAGKDRPDLRSPNALDALVRRLRTKIDAGPGPSLLRTLRGQGLLIDAT